MTMPVGLSAILVIGSQSLDRPSSLQDTHNQPSTSKAIDWRHVMIGGAVRLPVFNVL
jgi:hypothetical protein